MSTSARLHLGKIEVQASGLWRTLEIIGGVLIIIAAGIVLADPQFAVLTLIIVIAAGLIIGGFFRVVVGVSAIVLPSTLRTLNTAGGIIAMVLGIVALLDLQAANSFLITLLALAILLVGAFEIGVGVARHPPAWLRALIIGVGVLTVVLAGLVIIDPTAGETLLASVLALALLFVGIRNIVHGITGHHPISTLIDSQVTAA